MRSVACWVKSFSEEPRVTCAGGDFFSKKECAMRKNAEKIWRSRNKISNSPLKTIENSKCSLQNSGSEHPF